LAICERTEAKLKITQAFSKAKEYWEVGLNVNISYLNKSIKKAS
jgi:hypothetical protein